MVDQLKPVGCVQLRVDEKTSLTNQISQGTFILENHFELSLGSTPFQLRIPKFFTLPSFQVTNEWFQSTILPQLPQLTQSNQTEIMGLLSAQVFENGGAMLKSEQNIQAFPIASNPFLLNEYQAAQFQFTRVELNAEAAAQIRTPLTKRDANLNLISSSSGLYPMYDLKYEMAIQTYDEKVMSLEPQWFSRLRFVPLFWNTFERTPASWGQTENCQTLAQIQLWPPSVLPLSSQRRQLNPKFQISSAMIYHFAEADPGLQVQTCSPPPPAEGGGTAVAAAALPSSQVAQQTGESHDYLIWVQISKAEVKSLFLDNLTQMSNQKLQMTVSMTERPKEAAMVLTTLLQSFQLVYDQLASTDFLWILRRVSTVELPINFGYPKPSSFTLYTQPSSCARMTFQMLPIQVQARIVEWDKRNFLNMISTFRSFRAISPPLPHRPRISQRARPFRDRRGGEEEEEEKGGDFWKYAGMITGGFVVAIFFIWLGTKLLGKKRKSPSVPQQELAIFSPQNSPEQEQQEMEVAMSSEEFQNFLKWRKETS